MKFFAFFLRSGQRKTTGKDQKNFMCLKKQIYAISDPQKVSIPKCNAEEIYILNIFIMMTKLDLLSQYLGSR